MKSINPWMQKEFIGIDFSGAVDAGRAIWIASGHYIDGGIKIVDCRAAKDLLESGRKRDEAISALREYISRKDNAVVGCDFPFSLPGQLIEQRRWKEFIVKFPETYTSPGHFRDCCLKLAGGREIKRKSERTSGAPFCAYNLRLFRQTYYGICDLLYPLLAAGRASVLPMQNGKKGRAWLMEVCPASFLKREGHYPSYKGREYENFQARLSIVEFLESGKGLEFATNELRGKVLNNYGGDALDSVISAYCALFAGNKMPPAGEAEPEGYIFY